MIANDDNSARTGEATAEEEALLERASAPTVRDLLAVAKDQFGIIAGEPDTILSMFNSSGLGRRCEAQDKDK
jgi:hypothetical protein